MEGFLAFLSNFGIYFEDNCMWILQVFTWLEAFIVILPGTYHGIIENFNDSMVCAWHYDYECFKLSKYL